MIVNRYILKKVVKEERILKILLVKAVKYGITFDQMAKDKRGHTVPSIHFNINELIKKQDFWTNIVRKNHYNKNKKLLDLIVDIKNKLIEQGM